MSDMSSRRLMPLFLLCVMLAAFTAVLGGCRLIGGGWNEEAEVPLEENQTFNYQDSLLHTQQALDEARRGDPSITWNAGENAQFRGFTHRQILNLAGDTNASEVARDLLTIGGPVTLIELATGATPAPDDLFALGGISASPSIRVCTAANVRGSYSLPVSFSWRNRDGVNWLTPVRGQGGYDTCTTFAVLGAVESAMKIARADAGWSIDLAEAYLWYYGTARLSINRTPFPNSAKGWDRGLAAMFMLPPFGGVPLETAAPYFSFMADYSLFAAAPPPMEKFTANALFAFKGTAALKLALQKGPVVCSMDAHEFLCSYRSGVYTTIATPANYLIGPHAILVVGYDDRDNSWEIKNSWGPLWGDQGYFRIRQNDPAIAVNRHAYLLSVPVELIGRVPAPSAVASPGTTIQAEFGEPVRESTVSSETFRIIDGESRLPIAGSIAVGSDGRRLTFTPADPLAPGRTILCTVTTGIRSFDNDSLAGNLTWAFSTEGTSIASGAASAPAPVAIVLTGPDPVSVSTSARFEIGGVGIAAFRYRLDQGAFGAEQPATVPIILSGLGEGEHVLQILGRNGSGTWQDEASATTFLWRVAIPAGRAIILEAPPQVSISSAWEFAWTADADVVATKYQVDAGSWSIEIKPYGLGTYRKDGNLNPINGTHTFRLIAKNASGTWQATESATIYTWYVNTALGTKAVLSGLPPRQTRTTSARVSVDGLDVERYQYALDGIKVGEPLATGTPIVLTNLGLGTHTLRVVAVDTIGATQPIALASSHTWTILPPMVVLASTPDVLSATSTARFVASGEEIIEIRYRLDGGAFSQPASADVPLLLEGLADGAHTLRLIGRNAAGAWQAEASPTTFVWSILTRVASAAILSAPSAVSVSPEFGFTWTGGAGVTATRYSLDDTGVWSADLLPDPNGRYTLAGERVAAAGTHTIRIIARNAAGLWQAPVDAASHSWYVNPNLASQAVLANVPDRQTRMTRAAIAVSGAGFAQYRPSLDGGEFGAVTPINQPLSLEGLAVGTHTVRILAVDLAGVAQPVEFAASLTWTIEPPVAEFLSKPSGDTVATSATFVATGVEILEVKYSLDGAAFGAAVNASQPVVFEGLASGQHTVRVIGRNEAGTWQAEASATAHLWRVIPIRYQMQWGTANWDNPEEAVADAQGNLYVTGLTSGNLDGVVSNGGTDAFLTKIATDGTRLWTKLFGCGFSDVGQGIALAPDGDLIVTGYTNGTLPGQTHGGDYDLILARFAPDGTQRWLRQYGGATAEIGTRVAVDSTGKIHVMGRSFEVSGQTGLLLMRFDSAGEELFRQSFAINLIDSPTGIAVDSEGNSFLTGGIINTFNAQVSAGGVDCLLLKVRADGSIAWTRFLGTTADDRGKDIAVDASGNVYVSGETLGTFTAQISAGGRDAFLAKYDGAGTRLWVTQFGSEGEDTGLDLKLDALGAPFVSGTANGAFLGWNQIGDQDLFATSWDANGNRLWSGLYGTVGAESFPILVRDGVHPLTMLGSTDGTLSGASHAGSQDLVLWRLNAQGVAR